MPSAKQAARSTLNTQRSLRTQHTQCARARSGPPRIFVRGGHSLPRCARADGRQPRGRPLRRARLRAPGERACVLVRVCAYAYLCLCLCFCLCLCARARAGTRAHASVCEGPTPQGGKSRSRVVGGVSSVLQMLGGGVTPLPPPSPPPPPLPPPPPTTTHATLQVWRFEHQLAAANPALHDALMEAMLQARAFLTRAC